jgi:alkylhydroperoxidase/carboxymuconolactone decarboxylase family protein YurZ
MARVRYVEIEEAEGLVREVYEDIQRVRGRGRVSNLFKSYAHFPELLKANWEQSKAVMSDGALSHRFKEGLAVAISAANGCSY